MYDLYYYLAVSIPSVLSLWLIGLFILDRRRDHRIARELRLDEAFDRAQAAHDSQCNDWQPDTRPEPISRSDYERFLDQPDPDDLSIPGVHSIFPVKAIEEFRLSVKANRPPAD